MADLPISELQSLPDTIDDENTLFVAQQGDAAFKVDGHTFITELAYLLEAHGGVRTITTYYAVSSSNSTAPSTWNTTMQTMTNSNRYLWSYQNYVFSDGTDYDTVKTVIGVYGDKGDIGNTGAASSVVSQSTQYSSASSGSTAPSSGWSDNIPTVSAGNYLWTKVSVTFNDNTTAVWYSSARQGVNGTFGSSVFQVKLLQNGWSSNEQTISDANFENTGFYYVVTPSGSSNAQYISNGIIAYDVTTNGQMTFACSTVPSSSLDVNVLKVALV